MNTRKSSFGFTLAEILIAIFIFGIVATTIYSSLHSVLPKISAINEGMDAYKMAETCLNRIIIDLQSIYVTSQLQYSPPEFDSLPDLFRVTGDTSQLGDGDFARLRFASLAHVSFEERIRQGIARIVYYVLDTEDEGYTLYRSDSLQLDEPFEEKKSDPTLCQQVRSITFTYYDQEGETYDIWDSESDENDYATPSAIGIKLEFGNESPPYLFETTVKLPSYREGKT